MFGSKTDHFKRNRSISLSTENTVQKTNRFSAIFRKKNSLADINDASDLSGAIGAGVRKSDIMTNSVGGGSALAGGSASRINSSLEEKALGLIQLAKLTTHIDPVIVWQEKRDINDYLDKENDDEKQVSEKIFMKKNNNLLAVGKMVRSLDDEARYDEVMAEIDIVRKCNHENIIEFYDAYYFDSTLWLFTEYCPHGSVERLIDDLDTPLNEMQIHYVCLNVLKGLNFLHEKFNILHRDLRARNLLISENIYTIKLANFDVSAANIRLRSGSVGETPYVKSAHWMAPEILGAQTLLSDNLTSNCKSDIWSLGITCIEMAEKQPPNVELTRDQLVQHLRVTMKSPTLQDASVWSKDFVHFVHSCFFRRCQDRPSASVLLHHPFITNTKFFYKSDSKLMESLLEERKEKRLQRRVQPAEYLEDKMRSIKQMTDEPESYLLAYFDELRTKVEASADEAKKRIDAERSELIAKLKWHESTCLKCLPSQKERNATEFDAFRKRTEARLNDWMESGANSTRHMIEINESADKLLRRLKASLLLNREFSFEAAKSGHAGLTSGQLIVENIPSPTHHQHATF